MAVARLLVALLVAAAVHAPAEFATDAASPVGRIVPAPGECRVAPRSIESLRAFTTIAFRHGNPSTVTPTGTAPAPAGNATPVGRDSLDGVEAMIREAIACVNAGDAARRLALFTDAGGSRFVAVYGPPPVKLAGGPVVPAPLPPAQRIALLELRDVRSLVDGRVVVTVVPDAPADPRPPRSGRRRSLLLATAG